MHELCLSCLANEGIRVCVCVPWWKHGLLEDAVYDRMWKQSSRVFINSQERACTSVRVEPTAESASVCCGQTHIVNAGDLDYQMMVSHPHPCFSHPPLPFSTPTFSLSHRHTHSLFLPSHFLSHFLSFQSHFLSPSPQPLSFLIFTCHFMNRCN